MAENPKREIIIHTHAVVVVVLVVLIMLSSQQLLAMEAAAAATTHHTDVYAAAANSVQSSTNSTTSSVNTTLSALLALKLAISLDPTSVLALWNASASPDYCNWYGIRCAEGTRDVVAIVLDSNRLNGTLPPLLNQLPHLSYFNVSNNSFHGPIPAELGALSSLTHLDLSDNGLTGSIPSSLANCTLLQFLDLGINSLSGISFPAFITNLSQLVYLGLSANPFNPVGQLPHDIGRLSNLQFLQLYSSRLTGNLPPSITNCSRLLWLHLSENALTGPLPSDWSKLSSSIQRILLEDNSFIGSIPSALGNCTMLTQLGLSNNSLTGALPESLGKLAMLQYLVVFYNALTGSIPASLVNCTALASLQLSYNNLSGNIPAHIGQLNRLVSLTLTANANLTGSIPHTIGDCAQLQRLAIRRTQVGGPVPMSIYNLTSLQFLQLSASAFSGSIADDVRKMTALRSLALDQNMFHGILPLGLGELIELQGLDLHHNSFEGPIPQLWRGTSISLIDLSYNQLTGPIPTQLGQLLLLNKLYLQNNHLFGDIPDIFRSFTGLLILDLSHNMLEGQIPPSLFVRQSLDLSFNNLTGPIPQSFGSMQMVTSIRLAGNHLTGEIPEGLAGCQGLQGLDLSVNDLEGNIPSTLGQLRVLQYLNLSHNKLSGGLPPSLGDLHDLVSLNVSYNELQGAIPSTGIFKNLSADSFLGNPDLCGYPLSVSCIPPSRHSRTRTILILSICAIGAGVLMASMCAFSWPRWRWWWWLLILSTMSSTRNKIPLDDETDEEGILSGMEEPAHKLRAWKARELREATSGFDRANVIGSGGASVCFKGVMEDRGLKKLVAIKRLNSTASTRRDGTLDHARRSFVQELKTLCQVRHRNLVKTWGYCVEGGEVALVMEFMENGNLDEHLHTIRSNENVSKGVAGSWEERLRIAADVAEGLVYLHHESIQPIVHCDLKPANILLGSDMVAKISDFGLARVLAGDRLTENLHSTSNFRGTIGYAAPECAAGSQISTQADVYSYGVLLIELVTGTKPTSPQLQESGLTLHQWVRALLEHSMQGNALEGMVDTSIVEAIKKDPAISQQLDELLRLGANCTRSLAKERPNMKAVRETLFKVTKPKFASFCTQVGTWEILM